MGSAGVVVAVAGEAITDLVPAGSDGLFRAAPGGSPANVAVGLARLGVPVRMLARLSSDVFGRRLRRHLEDNGVDLTRAVVAAQPSSLAIVVLAADGSAEYDFRVDGTADWQWTDGELEGSVDDVHALHVGSLALTTPPGGAVLRRLAAHARRTATVTFDPNVRQLLMGSPEATMRIVDELLGVADVVKASAEDLAWLAPGRSLSDVATDWVSRGPALVVITRGGDGALAVGRSAGEVTRPGLRVDVVDTVGAGDSFMSALLAGLHVRDLLGASARDRLAALGAAEVAGLVDEAVEVSAVTCSRLGADPPTADEMGERRRGG
ncbi:MAG TPA: carbohydrate kinase [Actinomycetes bacterium]